jgi:hypothetical protein
MSASSIAISEVAKTLIDWLPGIIGAGVAIAVATRKLIRRWKYRHIIRMLGIRDGDKVIIVCSELSQAESRQLVEPPREWIYHMKYGDIDALFEITKSILRIYPNVKLSIRSCNEIQRTPTDSLAGAHIVSIGGPDYNSFVAEIIDRGDVRINYRSSPAQVDFYNEICLHDTVTKRTMAVKTLAGSQSARTPDIGYIEVLRSYKQYKSVILIGGCHTLGVYGASKFFSAFADATDENLISSAVTENARRTCGMLPMRTWRWRLLNWFSSLFQKSHGENNGQVDAQPLRRHPSDYVVVMFVDRFGSTVHTPTINQSAVYRCTRSGKMVYDPIHNKLPSQALVRGDDIPRNSADAKT